ncbi:MAG: LacI family transcriptional regulator [Micrococcales bacterium 73-15]|uniref:LacI family DNA-binding transcriptional regulator n=1 Tax=Salana multivorans TaxID=120377 RepID=UPI0009605A61|nr:LacI family DNA-binding transcriptional regulator [Salana multivorans]OJX96966.1 MAG: LacI family transcriptional regulator [Micrococcales bacterium 73-15]
MVTIADVAREAGVSLSTVSYALSGKRPISEKTRERIERAVEVLGYSPQASARALAMAQTNVLGLMAPLRPGVDLSVIMQFVAGITAEAHERSYDVLLVTHGDDSHLARVTRSAMIDGLVVMDIESEDSRLATLRELPAPVVLIGLPNDPTGLSCIDLDFERAGGLAARTLVEHGHGCVALLGAPQEVLARHASYAERMRTGFARAAEEAGVAHVEIAMESTSAGAVRAVDALLARHPDVTGIVVHNELALEHVVSHLDRRGLRIPRDVSLISVGPQDVASSHAVPTTGIDLPGELIGRLAVGMLMERLAGGADDDAPADVRLLPPQLTDRGSVAAPPAES